MEKIFHRKEFPSDFTGISIIWICGVFSHLQCSNIPPERSVCISLLNSSARWVVAAKHWFPNWKPWLPLILPDWNWQTCRVFFTFLRSDQLNSRKNVFKYVLQMNKILYMFQWLQTGHFTTCQITWRNYGNKLFHNVSFG